MPSATVRRVSLLLRLARESPLRALLGGIASLASKVTRKGSLNAFAKAVAEVLLGDPSGDLLSGTGDQKPTSTKRFGTDSCRDFPGNLAGGPRRAGASAKRWKTLGKRHRDGFPAGSAGLPHGPPSGSAGGGPGCSSAGR